jgi:hypothetical protein
MRKQLLKSNCLLPACVILGIAAILTRMPLVSEDPFIINWNDFHKTWTHVGALFNADYFIYSFEGSFRPVINLLYLIQFTLFQDMWGLWRITSLITHMLSAWLVFRIMISLQVSHPVARNAALLFVISPLTLEPLAVISFQEDVFVLLFSLVSILAGLRFIESGKRSLITVSAVALVLALFTKENGGIAVAILCITAGKKSWRERRWRTLLLVLGSITLAYLWVRFAVLPGDASAIPRPAAWQQKLFVLGTPVFYYATRLILPVAPWFSGMNHPAEIPAVVGWVSAGFAFMLLLFLIRTAFRYPTTRLPLAWLAVGYVPVANFVPLNRAISDRLVYLVLPAVCWLLALGIERFRKNRWLPAGVIALLRVSTGVHAWHHRSYESYWHLPHVGWGKSEQALKHAEIQVAAGNCTKALEIIQGLEIKPSENPVFGYSTLGHIHFHCGNQPLALELGEKAANYCASAVPHCAWILERWANALIKEGNFPLAQRVLKKAMEIAPGQSTPHAVMADLWNAQENPTQAALHRDIAKKRNPLLIQENQTLK